MGDEDFDLSQAYAVETPDDNRRLYRSWASTYDDDFVAAHGYVYHEAVVRALGRRLPVSACDGAVLDVGCGTGVVGIALREAGYPVVDGVDISREMLEVAAAKVGPDDAAVYRALTPADLTGTTSLVAHSYRAIVSAGAFTHGHLGPEPIGELLRVAQPGAVFALGVNAEHFESAGFASWFAGRLEVAEIVDLEIVEASIYDPARYTAADLDQHADDKSSVAVFELAPLESAGT